MNDQRVEAIAKAAQPFLYDLGGPNLHIELAQAIIKADPATAIIETLQEDVDFMYTALDSIANCSDLDEIMRIAEAALKYGKTLTPSTDSREG